MSKLIVLVISIIFISCNHSKKESSISTKNNTNSEKNIKQKLSAYCFFALDDKYAEEKDSLVINTWLKERSISILKNDTTENIFNQNGGGPNGAQWNPATDLYIAISTPLSDLPEIPKLHVNGKLYQKQIYTYSSQLIWYVVKQDFWEREIRAIDSLDIKKMYSTQWLNGIKNGQFSPNAPLNEGEILKFEISHKEENLTKFFHAAYGE